jgi:hypothetical protein
VGEEAITKDPRPRRPDRAKPTGLLGNSSKRIGSPVMALAPVRREKRERFLGLAYE